MQLLKDRILTDGVVKEGNILKVDSFLNHQMDIDLINEVGKEFKKRFDHCPITKILTIEASGIGIACIAAQYFHVPVVFAQWYNLLYFISCSQSTPSTLLSFNCLRTAEIPLQPISAFCRT